MSSTDEWQLEAEEPEPWQAGQCCHCLVPLNAADVGPRNTAFCGEFCKHHAEMIRYDRQAIRDGRSLVAMTAAVISNNHITFLALDLAYVRKKLPQSVRREVLAANEGLCVECEVRIATEVDHISGGSNERSNLRGLCRICHELKPRGDIPDDLTRDGAGAVDDSEVSNALRMRWSHALRSQKVYADAAPAEPWRHLLWASEKHIDNRFARITLAILRPEPVAPAHRPEWATAWRAYAEHTRKWAVEQLSAPT